MQHFGRVMLLTLGLGLFAVVLSFFPSQHAVANKIDAVMVTNMPLPVSGTVAVSNFPSNSGNVTVANTTANPVPITAGRVPWSTSCALITPGLYLYWPPAWCASSGCQTGAAVLAGVRFNCGTSSNSGPRKT